MSDPARMTRDEWLAEGQRRFGADVMAWRFVCPICKHVASVRDWRDAGAPEGAVGFSCVGRWLEKCSAAFSKEPGPCNYAGGGLFRLNPIIVTDGEVEHQRFAFDDAIAPEDRP